MSYTPTWTTSRIYGHLWLRAVLLVVPFFAAFFLPGEFADPDGTPWFLLAVLTFMTICMWPLAFAAHWVEGNATGLRLRYWPLLTRAVTYDDLASVEYRPNASPWDFGGIGLRLTSDGTALVNRKGPGFAVRTNSGKSYFVIVKDDRELADIRNHISQARQDLSPELEA